jgi:shikimate dehydrogenase
MIGARTELFGVLGWPARHSLSPAMHQAAFAACGLDCVYLAFEVRPEWLERALHGALAMGMRGLNLTIPHKEAACALCSRLSDEARRLGAVNTLRVVDGALHGHNTDALGFARALALAPGFDPAGARALVLGAGGAARAVVGALAGEAAAVRVACRSQGRGERLLGELAPTNGRAVPWEAAALETELRNADLVVSCLPPDVVPPGLAGLRSKTVVLDVNYAGETALLATARRVRARAATGLEMLVQQGALAFEHWTGRPAPISVMRTAAEAELKARG